MYSLYAVDDDALQLDEITGGVPWMENGFELVGACANPFTALDEITRLRPNAVVCDLKMPGMDGIQLFRRLRQNGVESEFVMLSAFGTFEDSRSFFRQGGFDYILKPLDLQQVQMVFERLARKLSGAGPFADAYGCTGVPGFDALVAYIAEHYNEKFTLEKLGQQFHLSPNYICNLFSRHYNVTFTAFLTDIRMKKAAELISASGSALKEIAINCGYTNYFYFCKQFKAYYGCSPSVWREQEAAAGQVQAQNNA